MIDTIDSTYKSGSIGFSTVHFVGAYDDVKVIDEKDLKNGLVAHWSFDDCSAKDNSGNGHDGTLNGNPQCVEGVKGKAFSFDGVDDFISVSSTPSLTPVNQLTMSFWIRVDGFDNYSGIIYKGGSKALGPCNQNRDYSVWIFREQPGFQQDSAENGNCIHSLATKGVIITGEWLHYIGIIDRVNHNAKIYINGHLSAQRIDNYNNFTQSNTDLRIGFPDELTDHSPFNGALDDLRIYNRALSEAEVMALYNGNEAQPEQTGAIDLSLDLTAPATVKTSEKTTYQLTATNNGNSIATGVKAHFVVPRKSIATVEIPKNCTLIGRIIECALPDLDANQSATQTFSMTALRKGAMNVVGLVNSDADDANLSDNKLSAVVSVK